MKQFIFAGLVCLIGFLAFANSQDGTVNSHNKIMGCYVGVWSFYRTWGQGIGKFDVEDIDPMLCTHGFYGFAVINNETTSNVPFTIRSHDPWYDLASTDCEPGDCFYDGYRRFVGLKQRNPNFVPMISVGGWNEGSKNFSKMVANPTYRKNFIDSAVAFCELYGFEGVDFDWEYPGWREHSDPANDKDNFSIFIREFATALHNHQPRLLLTAAVSPSPIVVEGGYDLPELNKWFDFINIMTYDYHGYWDEHVEYTGHNAPIITNVEEQNNPDHPGYRFSVYESMMLYIDGGFDRNKVVLGLPLYGRGFTLVDPNINGLYCPANGPLPEGPTTLLNATWGYQEVAIAQTDLSLFTNLPGAVNMGWQITRDRCYQAPYMHNNVYWIGYDDVESVTLKTHLANQLGVAGCFVWSMDTDDFRGYADISQEPYPMIKAINRGMASGLTYMPPMGCVSDAPWCDLFPPVDPTLPAACTQHLEVHPMPDNCHQYYRCFDDNTDGIFTVKIENCDDFIFDPVSKECVHPSTPGVQGICN